MPIERRHYGPSPSRRKKLDELWMRGQDAIRTIAGGVVVQSLSGIVADDGTLATSAVTGYIPESLGIAKGDILVATGPSTFVRLAAPAATGYHLVTDPSTATGLRWEATPAGGLSGILAGADNVIDGTDEVVVS